MICNACKTDLPSERFAVEKGYRRRKCKGCKRSENNAHRSKWIKDHPQEHRDRLNRRNKSGGPRKYLAPISDGELLRRINKRRWGTQPIYKLFHGDLRITPAALMHCLLALVRQAQIARLRNYYRKLASPGYSEIARLKNHAPGLKEKRAESTRRARIDPERSQRYKEVSAAGSVRNRQRIYARKLERKPITQERDRKYIREWQRHKRATDPQYNVGNRLRSRLWNALTGQGVRKGTSTEILIGCTIAEARKHIESLFTAGMTWERFLKGEIHIDHKKPCASFNLSDESEQKKCFHFSNLQPLWERDNLSKSDSLLDVRGIGVNGPDHTGPFSIAVAASTD